MARQPYLHEYYGTVEWSVRAIFDGYLGWFGGNATDLFPLAQAERAKHFSNLVGGETAHVCRGVAEIQPKFPDNPDLVVSVDSNVWKEVAAGVRNPTLAFFRDMDKEGGILKLMKFLNLFKSE